MTVPLLRHVLLWVAIAPTALAEVKLPAIFTDGAVLQRDRTVPVWGTAAGGRKVTVKFAEQEKATTAGPDGRWRIELDALPANATGRTLEATEEGGNRIEIKDVLVGEVWLASGQSNMQWPVRDTRPEDLQLANSGPLPLLRLFQVPNKVSAYRLEDVAAKWTGSQPEQVQGFSAVAYFFGRRLTEELGVPVGLIDSSWGGSRIEPWLADEGFAQVPDLEEMRQYRERRIPDTAAYREGMKRHLVATRAWLDAADRAAREEKPFPAQPSAPPVLPVGFNQALGLYQAMIHPLTPYALRGFLWYQGESNLGEGLLYTLKMEALIHGWRKQFGAPEAPFLFVQLAPYNYGADREGALPELWVAQQEALHLPHTGMAVTMDIGNPADIHPRNKSEVGRRLALWALADTYGKKDLVKSGPLFESFEVAGDALRVKFSSAPTGLTTRDGQPPRQFEIAGANWIFKPATAEIAADGQSVVLRSAEVPEPKMARFAWSQVAEPNLSNKEGLPAAAFHTHWPDDPVLGRNLAGQRTFISSDPNSHGWNSGLTDGNWFGAAGTCFATGEAPVFPKNVTVDLGRERQIQAVRFGVPGFGATRTVAISVSGNGQDFQEIGRHEFAPKTEARAELRFDSRPVRFVRATFVDHHERQDIYSENHGFLSELEAYGK